MSSFYHPNQGAEAMRTYRIVKSPESAVAVDGTPIVTGTACWYRKTREVDGPIVSEFIPYVGWEEIPAGFDIHLVKAMLLQTNVLYLKACAFQNKSEGQNTYARMGERHYIYHARKLDLVKYLVGEVPFLPRPIIKSGEGRGPRGTGGDDGNTGPAPVAVTTPDPAVTPIVTVDLSKLEKDLRDKIAAELATALGEDKITGILQEIVRKNTPTTVEIVKPDGSTKIIGLQHETFPKLLKYASTGCNVYMVGPAGSGKSRAGLEVAKALDLPFYAESVSQQTPVSKLMGYMDANGNYVSTSFRRAVENGGVFLLDEIDNGNANVIASLNATAACGAGELVSFPDGMVVKHKDCIILAAANTIGRGGDREYVGRNPLDAASIDRFIFLEWNYDEKLENALCALQKIDSAWVTWVQKIRRATGELGVRLVVSPRAAVNGGKLIQIGVSWEEAEYAAIFKGIDTDQVLKIKTRAKNYA